MSYTNYKYANLKLAKKSVGKDEKVQAMVDVTNTGSRSGEEIVQLYVGYNGTKIDRPIKDLKAFSKVELETGQTARSPFVSAHRPWYNSEKGGWEIENIEYVVYVGPSASPKDLTLKDSFKVNL